MRSLTSRIRQYISLLSGYFDEEVPPEPGARTNWRSCEPVDLLLLLLDEFAIRPSADRCRGPTRSSRGSWRSAGRPGPSARDFVDRLAERDRSGASRGSARSSLKNARSQPFSKTCSFVPGQTPNFSPSSPKTATAFETFSGESPQVVDRLGRTSANGIVYRSFSLSGKDLEEPAFVLGQVVAVELVLVEAGPPPRLEVGVVDER